MTAEQFAYWLQGFAELSPTPPTQEQWDLIKAHLELQFKKVTPPLALPQTDKNLLDKLKDAAKEGKLPSPDPWKELREWKKDRPDLFPPDNVAIC